MATTPNLGLHQWDAEDAFLREEFNENFGRIDGAALRVTSGTFTGNGVPNRKITVGFRPKLLILMGSSNGNGGLAVFSAGCMGSVTPPFGGASADYSGTLTLEEDGFTIHNAIFMNASGISGYIVLG